MTASIILTHPCLRYRIRPIPRDCSLHQSDVMVSCLPAQAHQCGGQDCPAHEAHRNRTHERAAQRVSLFVCELRHITLPGIDLVCRRFLPRLGPVANGGFLLRGAGLLNSLSETHDQGRL